MLLKTVLNDIVIILETNCPTYDAQHFILIFMFKLELSTLSQMTLVMTNACARDMTKVMCT